jgi:hypothetical protein
MSICEEKGGKRGEKGKKDEGKKVERTLFTTRRSDCERERVSMSRWAKREETKGNELEKFPVLLSSESCHRQKRR